MRIRTACIIWALAAGAMALPAAAQERRPGVPRVLVDRRLQERSVRVTGLDGKSIAYVDSTGLPRTEPVAEFVALLMPEESEAGTTGIALGVGRASGAQPGPRFRPPAPVTLLELVDGERFAGALSLEGSGERLGWTHPAIGTMSYDLEDVLRVRLLEAEASERPMPPVPGGADVVTLANGDRLEGYVEAVAREVRLQAGTTVRRVAVELVREVSLANETKRGAERQYWLRDGSVVSPRDVRTTRAGELILSVGRTEPTENPAGEAGGELPPLQLDDLIGATFDGAMVPIARLAASQRSVSERAWSGPVRVIEGETALLGLAAIEIPGPMEVEWVLPAGATRVAFEAELPRPCWTWGDLEVVVLSAGGGSNAEGTELARRRLHADQPRARVNVPLVRGAKRLRVRVEAGVSGAVQDRVVLHRGAVLVEP
ncbi:MAG: hypothetical protein ACKVW3_11250 [Phycisphaerales bacterium]